MKENFFGKTVLVTGHTGFKGSWLIAWLNMLGANVVGIGLKPHTFPSHFEVADMIDGISNHYIDIRDLAQLQNIVAQYQPDYVFHLAAQSLVAKSYDDPVETWTVNLVGVINILESLRMLKKRCDAIIITSDKCYENLEWIWGYRENDRLGGKDPYSASKGAAEIAVRSFIKSYFTADQNNVRVASVRAGNVIGGGDWSENRIVPDCVKAWSKGETVFLRNPHATRPWQHVLEPIGGYLLLATKLTEKSALSGESFNFGPPAHQDFSVGQLVTEMSKNWSNVRWEIQENETPVFYEAGLLKLNCDKALSLLGWQAKLSFEKTVKYTADWYKAFYDDESSIQQVTENQIKEYMS